MCTYNGSQYLGEQLQSIEQQNRLPDELIIVDDCSVDETHNIITEFIGRSRISVRYIRNEKRLGVSKNFEKALLAAEGEVIFLADQDDLWKVDKLTRLVGVMGDIPTCQLVFSDGDCIDSNGSRLGFTLWDKCGRANVNRLVSTGRHQLSSVLKRDLVTGATIGLRRKFLDSALPIPEIWVHDSWFAAIAASQNAIVAVDEALIEYRVHATQQIGVGQSSLPLRVQDSRQRDRKLAERRFMHLEATVGRSLTPALQKELRGKIEHLGLRASLSPSFLKRSLQITLEAISGRYHRFSSGLDSILVDFVR